MILEYVRCLILQFKINKAIKYYWPNITLNLEEYDYILFPENYFVELNFNGQIGACLGYKEIIFLKLFLGQLLCTDMILFSIEIIKRLDLL